MYFYSTKNGVFQKSKVKRGETILFDPYIFIQFVRVEKSLFQHILIINYLYYQKRQLSCDCQRTHNENLWNSNHISLGEPHASWGLMVIKASWSNCYCYSSVKWLVHNYFYNYVFPYNTLHTSPYPQLFPPPSTPQLLRSPTRT